MFLSTGDSFFRFLLGALRRCKPDAWKVSDADEVGEQFSISPVGLVERLFHPRRITGMSETDRPLILGEEFFGEDGGTRAGFDRGVDVGAVGCDDTKDGGRIVGDGLRSGGGLPTGQLQFR